MPCCSNPSSIGSLKTDANAECNNYHIKWHKQFNLRDLRSLVAPRGDPPHSGPTDLNCAFLPMLPSHRFLHRVHGKKDDREIKVKTEGLMKHAESFYAAVQGAYVLEC